MVSSGPICARTIDCGIKQHTLGRWSWIKVRGTKGLTLIVATVYRPVHVRGEEQTC
jgi:hypothetical protein